MGLIKAIIVVVISVLAANFLKKIAEANKNKPFIKHIKPYLDNRCYVILAVTVSIMVLF